MRKKHKTLISKAESRKLKQYIIKCSDHWLSNNKFENVSITLIADVDGVAVSGLMRVARYKCDKLMKSRTMTHTNIYLFIPQSLFNILPEFPTKINFCIHPMSHAKTCLFTNHQLHMLLRNTTILCKNYVWFAKMIYLGLILLTRKYFLINTDILVTQSCWMNRVLHCKVVIANWMKHVYDCWEILWESQQMKIKYHFIKNQAFNHTADLVQYT